MKNSQQNKTEYILGGVIAFFFFISLYYVISSIGAVGLYSLLFVIIGIPVIYYFLSKKSPYLALGFAASVFIPILGLALLITEITIHPPSEE